MSRRHQVQGDPKLRTRGAGSSFLATAALRVADGAGPAEATAEGVDAATDFVRAGGLDGVFHVPPASLRPETGWSQNQFEAAR